MALGMETSLPLAVWPVSPLTFLAPLLVEIFQNLQINQYDLGPVQHYYGL